MKYDAIKRRSGRRKKDAIDYHFKGKRSVNVISEEMGDSPKQVQRYLKLTELIPEMLEMLDDEMILKEYVEQISMLNALIKVSEKILIFCEGGQIKKPTAHSPLMLLLDQMVIPVTLPGKTGRGRFPAFHPKTWVLQYRNAYDKIEAEENISYTVTGFRLL